MNNDETMMTLEEMLAESYDFSGTPPEEQDHIISEAASLITESALLRSLDAAGETVQQQFDQFMEMNPDDEQLSTFIQESIPNFQEFLKEEIELFHAMNTVDDETLEKTAAE